MSDAGGTGKGIQSRVTLPVSEEQLGDFITGLLGQPQSVEREVRFPFDIDQAWLVDLFQKIDQRVTQQATFVQKAGFRATIFLEGGVNVLWASNSF